MAGKNTAAFGIFPTRSAAENAVDQLTAAGFSNQDVSVLMSDKTGSQDFAAEKNTKAPEGTATGVGVGGVLGGATTMVGGIANAALHPIDTMAGVEAMAEHAPGPLGTVTRGTHDLIDVARDGRQDARRDEGEGMCQPRRQSGSSTKRPLPALRTPTGSPRGCARRLAPTTRRASTAA